MKPGPGTFLHETRRIAKWLFFIFMAGWLAIFLAALFA